MAVLSDYEEPTMTVPSTKQFNGVLDSSNPLGFIESALEFAARESNLFQSDSVVNDVSLIVRGLKEKVDAEEKAAKEKKVNDIGGLSILYPRKMEIEQVENTLVSKDKIFVQALHGDREEFRFSEFYTIDMRDGQVSACPYALFTDSGYNNIVSLGSVVYVVGALRPDQIRCKTQPPQSRCTKKGQYHYFMSYLDLANDTGDGWKEGPGLSTGPCANPSVLAFGGKIYLFPISANSETAYVFDPISNEWEPLLLPPGVDFYDSHYETSVVADFQNKRILVYFEDIKSLFAYFPANKHWELVVKPLLWCSSLVFVDGVIFSYLPEAPQLVAAYHVATDQFLDVKFTSKLPVHIWRIEYDSFFHLGGDVLCLAAYSSDVSPPQTHVYLTKFTFKCSPHNPAKLLITMLPEESYDIPLCSMVDSIVPI